MCAGFAEIWISVGLAALFGFIASIILFAVPLILTPLWVPGFWWTNFREALGERDPGAILRSPLAAIQDHFVILEWYWHESEFVLPGGRDWLVIVGAGCVAVGGWRLIWQQWCPDISLLRWCGVTVWAIGVWVYLYRQNIQWNRDLYGG